MPAIEKYEHGMFCWVELATSDAAAAKAFYTSLFGWVASDMPNPDGGVYTMMQKDGRNVCALYSSKEAHPNWASYVNVDSVDETAKTARDRGANVIAGPFDVKDIGRMAVINDPQGATFCLWHPNMHIGATIRDEANTLCWNELMTPDAAASRDFYKAVFGWNLKPSPEYTEIYVGEVPIGGILQITKDMEGMPANWSPYFAVDDCDATVEKAKSLGAQIHVPPTDIPNTGRFSVMSDPQGAMFDIIKLSPHH
jgi:predicted enzyme related to lactoylglutathione lyase